VDQAFIADPHPHRVEVDDCVHRVQRPRLPLPDLVVTATVTFETSSAETSTP
jgi:hypothetical protein